MSICAGRKELNWKKGLKRAFEEAGKHLLNIGVAIIVFAILQPIVKNEFSLKSSLIFGIVYLIIFAIAVFLIIIGGDEDE
jgi:ABC-type Mn2+/Zn2+ transport system permease subunit